MIRKIIVLLIIGMLLFGCTGGAKKKAQGSEEVTGNGTGVLNTSENASGPQEQAITEMPAKTTAEQVVLPELLKSKMSQANSESVIEINRLWNVQEGDKDFDGLSRWQYITSITLRGKLKDVIPTEEERMQGIIWKYQMQKPIVSYSLNNTYFFDWKPRDFEKWCTISEETFVPETRSVDYASLEGNLPLEIIVYKDNTMKMDLPFDFEARYYFKSNCKPEKAKGSNMQTSVPVRIEIPLTVGYVRGSIVQTGTSRMYTYGAAIRPIDTPGNERIYFNDAEVHFPPEQNPPWVISWRLVTTE